MFFSIDKVSPNAGISPDSSITSMHLIQQCVHSCQQSVAKVTEKYEPNLCIFKVPENSYLFLLGLILLPTDRDEAGQGLMMTAISDLARREHLWGCSSATSIWASPCIKVKLWSSDRCCRPSVQLKRVLTELYIPTITTGFFLSKFDQFFHFLRMFQLCPDQMCNNYDRSKSSRKKKRKRRKRLLVWLQEPLLSGDTNNQRTNKEKEGKKQTNSISLCKADRLFPLWCTAHGASNTSYGVLTSCLEGDTSASYVQTTKQAVFSQFFVRFVSSLQSLAQVNSAGDNCVHTQNWDSWGLNMQGK